VNGDELYDEFYQFWLQERPMSGEEASGIPTVAYLCNRCGAVVVDQPVHDNFHDSLENR
jgi:hypothetical protein